MAIFLYEKPVQRHFLNLDDLFSIPSLVSEHCLRPSRQISRSTHRNDAGSKIWMDKNAYKVSLDVQHFSPEEISVKAAGNHVIVEGKHDDKEDEYGSISRHFVRTYVLPEGYCPEDIVSSLSSNGQLTITAPRKKVPKEEERVIPIKLTDKPHREQKTVEEKSQENS